ACATASARPFPLNRPLCTNYRCDFSRELLGGTAQSIAAKAAPTKVRAAMPGTPSGKVARHPLQEIPMPPVLSGPQYLRQGLRLMLSPGLRLFVLLPLL